MLNAGSSSLKLRVLDARDQTLVRRELGGTEVSAKGLLAGVPEVLAAVHRLVHGGPRFEEAVMASDDAIEAIEALGDIAPLHNGPALRLVRLLQRERPDLPQVLCFDTSFHRTLSAGAAVYAIPAEWSEGLGVRRYGFHGLSHAYASRRADELLGHPPGGVRAVTCHLGAGASLAAVRDGRSVDTTMGFTPNDGLVMATRSGSFDPGALLWILEHESLSPAEARLALERESGLLGLSGVSGDLREVLDAAGTGHERAARAIEVYVHRLRAGIAAMAASMDGADAVVFTGGVGENAPSIRARVCEGLGFLGLALDAAADESGAGDRDIGHPDAETRVLVVESREDLQMAREARALLGERAEVSA